MKKLLILSIVVLSSVNLVEAKKGTKARLAELERRVAALEGQSGS